MPSSPTVGDERHYTWSVRGRLLTPIARNEISLYLVSDFNETYHRDHSSSEWSLLKTL